MHARPTTRSFNVSWPWEKVPLNATSWDLEVERKGAQATRSLVFAAQNSTYDVIVTSSVSSAGSMMPMSIDPHALHLKL